MAKTFRNMTVDELTAEIVRLSNEREALRERQVEVSRIRDEKLTAQYERERLRAAGFSDERIDAIAHAEQQAVTNDPQEAA